MADDPARITFDFDKPPLGTLRVAGESSDARVSGSFTTNAARYEPGQFRNGIEAFAPPNVFILHNSGAAQGGNQKWVYLALSTVVPLGLRALQFDASSNAAGSSSDHPVIIAIELLAAGKTPESYEKLGEVSIPDGPPHERLGAPRRHTGRHQHAPPAVDLADT